MKPAALLLLAATLAGAEAPAGWKPVWSDDFNGKEIDFSKWAVEENGHGGGNGEMQYYVEFHTFAIEWEKGAIRW